MAASFVSELTGYLSDFQSIFKSRTRSCFSAASDYFKGLLQSEKKQATCWRMGRLVPHTNSQSLNHQLSDGVWSYQALMDAIARRCSRFFLTHCTKSDTCLIVDELGFQKKGTQSACVSRQWLGCIGKQDNGQVAVALALANNLLSSIINLQLFIPKSWWLDQERCKQAGVPLKAYQTKPELALAMIKKAVLDGIKFSWICFDALYGSSLPFIRALNEMGLTFMGDLRGDITVFTDQPKVSIPPNTSSRGRRFRFSRPETAPTTIDTYAKGLQDEAWHKTAFRAGTKGWMEFYYHKKQIWIWDEKNRELISFILLIRKSIDGNQYKYSLSNADEKVSLKRLAYMQGQRFFIEQSFKEGKNQTGMGDYQVRSWNGFHRHMALSMLALNFLMEQKHRCNKGDFQDITLPVLVEIIKVILPVRHTSLETLLEEIKQRLYLYRKQKEKALLKE